MEEIIGLLVALAAIIFKVVGKRLEKSGAPAAGIPEDSPEEPAGNPFDVKKWIEEVPKPKPFIEEAPRAVVKPAPKVNILKEDAPEVKEKIDPKKLVVYSEIMKPKFKEEN